MDPTCDWQQLAPSIHEPVRRFVFAASASFPHDLRAITIFGAASSNQFNPRRHAVRSAIVVDEVDLGEVFEFGKHGRSFGKCRFVAPWILTPNSIRASLDTFPLELLEIRSDGVTVHGTDFFADLTFHETHVRLQCERELKAALSAIHHAVVGCAGDARQLATIAEDAALGIARTLIGLLWIHEVRERLPDAVRVSKVETIVGRELHGLRATMSADGRTDLNVLEQLYRDLAWLGEYANAR